jgi:hypothetical protein
VAKNATILFAVFRAMMAFDHYDERASPFSLVVHSLFHSKLNSQQLVNSDIFGKDTHFSRRLLISLDGWYRSVSSARIG